MKKVLSLVFNNFKNDSRVLKECTSLQTAGYHVRIVALHEGDLPVKEQIRGIVVDRILLKTRSLPKNLPCQLIKYCELTFKILKVGLFYQKTDIIHCNDLGPLPIAVTMKLLSGGKIKIVYDAHELETEQESKPNPFRHFMSVLSEKVLIHHADVVITVSNGIAKEYVKRYGIPEPVLVLNCPPFNEVFPADCFRETFNISNKKTIFLYQGGLSPGRGVELLLETFHQLDRKDAVLIIMGYGPLESLVREAGEKCNRIFYYPAVPPEELAEYTASADVGISIIENTCLSYYYCLPNKLFEYAMAGLPVIINDLPEMRHLMEKYQCGVICCGEKKENLVQAIERMLAANLSLLGQNARKMARDYNWSVQETKLLQVYEDLS